MDGECFMSEEAKKEVIKVRSYPKMIFFVPSFIVAILLGFLSFIPDQLLSRIFPILAPADLALINNIFAWIFFICFAWNVFVATFDFPSARFFLLILGFVALILVSVIVIMALYLAGMRDASFVFIYAIVGFFQLVQLPLSTTFYFAYAALFGIVFGFVALAHKWDYLEVTRMYYIKHHGFRAREEATRYPTKGIVFHKDIEDYFEYFLFRAGEITLIPARGTDVIHLPTVFHVNKIHQRLNDLLGMEAVTVAEQRYVEPEIKDV